MTTLTITVDDHLARRLQETSEREGCDLSAAASRYLKKAFLMSRPRPTYEVARIRAANAEFMAEDREFDDLDSEETVELLRRADEE